jgi:hypothetical protein
VVREIAARVGFPPFRAVPLAQSQNRRARGLSDPAYGQFAQKFVKSLVIMTIDKAEGRDMLRWKFLTVVIFLQCDNSPDEDILKQYETAEREIEQILLQNKASIE